MQPLEEAPFFNWFDPEVQVDPVPYLTDLRSRTSVARTPIGATVVRREPVHRLLSDARLRSALPHLAQLQGIPTGPMSEMLETTILALDGEDHTRLRRLVSRAFTPRAADKHREHMRTLADDLVEGFRAERRCEFMTAFADRYPIQVFCEVIGVPPEDHASFARWGDSLTYVLSMELGAHLEEVATTARELNVYVDALIAERATSPRDDLVSELVQLSEAGDRLSPIELRTMIGGLLFAGYDTTRNQLGRALVLFCHHPEQWSLLAEDPDLAPGAVDETMRLAGAVGGVPRITSEEVEVDGWLIPANTIVFLSFASANRDESSYEEPHRFDITAERTPHLSFGGGPHYCLGANLARAELEEAFRVLPRRMTGIRLTDEPVWRLGTGITGPAALHLAFDAT